MKLISNIFTLFFLLTASQIQAKDITVKNPQELAAAVKSAAAGDKILLQEGLYKFDASLKISASGNENQRIFMLSDPKNSGRPVFDFSALPEGSSSNGIALKGSYWHIKGIDVVKAGHNGLKIQGSNNIIEFCTFSQNFDTGVQLADGASNNTILNCDSFENADSKKENADGFAAKTDGGTGNKFIGCRAWNNMDDGWDGYLREANNISTSYENCWAFRNGLAKDGTVTGGDGNGFKTGGSDDKTLKHNAVYKNCIAAANAADGFDHNSNSGEVTLLNCAAYGNKRNLSFSKTSPLAKLTIKNTVVVGPTGSLSADQTDISNNSWQSGKVLSETDVKSTDINQLLKSRKEDGSLPDVDFLKPLAKSSQPSATQN